MSKLPCKKLIIPNSAPDCSPTGRFWNGSQPLARKPRREIYYGEFSTRIPKQAMATPMGGTGHWPVPSGDPPLGMGNACERFCAAVAGINVLPVPSGQWPSGTGGSPVLPRPTSEFGLNAICQPAVRRSPLTKRVSAAIVRSRPANPLANDEKNILCRFEAAISLAWMPDRGARLAGLLCRQHPGPDKRHCRIGRQRSRPPVWADHKNNNYHHESRRPGAVGSGRL